MAARLLLSRLGIKISASSYVKHLKCESFSRRGLRLAAALFGELFKCAFCAAYCAGRGRILCNDLDFRRDLIKHLSLIPSLATVTVKTN